MSEGIILNDNHITPIIVVGMNRSGTRWLTTLLCCHPDVAGIRDTFRENVGDLALETNMFSIFPKMYGDISKLNKYIAMVEQWQTTQFFRLLQVNRNELYSLDPKPENCFVLFKTAMDIHARKAGKKYWVQKTTPKCSKNVLKSIPEAKYITIQRDILTNLRSKLKRLKSESHNNRITSKEIARLVFLYSSDSWMIRKLQKDQKVSSHVVMYEDLASDTTLQLHKICDFLEVRFSDSLLGEQLYRNTRFNNMPEKEQFFSRSTQFKIRFFQFLFSLIPGRLQWYIRNKFGGLGESDFINATFRQIKDEFHLQP